LRERPGPRAPGRRAFWLVWLLAAALLLDGAAALAADVAGTTMTIPYYYTETLQNKEKSYLSLYEFVDVSAANLGADHLDIYFSGWGRGDVLSKMDTTYHSLGDAQLDSLYVRWHDDRNIIDVSAGRRLTTIGDVNEQIDGAQFQFQPIEQFGIQGFGGVPVFSKTGDYAGNYCYGGRIYGAYRPYFEIGVSGASFIENHAPDRLFIGPDLIITPASRVDILGHLYYDFLYSSIFDAAGSVVVRPMTDMKVLARWERVMPSAYLGMSSFFSVFTFETIDKIEGEWKYIAANRVALGAEYDNYQYDNARSGNRFGGSVGPLWGEKRENSFNVGLYKLDRSDNGYLEGRAYLYQDIVKKAYIALDGIYYKLDRSIDKVSEGFEGDGTIGYHIIKDLDLQASGIYLSSPYYRSDVRGLMKLSYNFGTPPQLNPGEIYAKR
jgi:hypothetical protein